MILDGATGQIICHGQKSQKKENGYPTFNRKSLQWVSKPLLLGWWPSSMIWKQREFRPNRTDVHHRSCIKVYKNTLLEGCAINFGQKEYLEKAAGHVLDMRIIFHKAWLTVLVNHPKQILDTILLERIAKHLVLDERWYQPPVVSLQLTELANMAMPSNSSQLLVCLFTICKILLYIYSIQVTCSHSPNDVGFEAGSNNQWKVGYNFPISMKICKSLDYNINYRVFMHLSARPGEWSKSNQKPHNQKCLSKVKPFEHGHFAQPSYIYIHYSIYIYYILYILYSI